ncbi:HAD hydrolase-like protein [Gordonia bronchialis]|uniref:HAD family hydrolase n=1 Tax=Gordonia bronchialis TaxID=2054 RepID=UPI000A035500|nr:HAD family hydrolase [Gordonia bronchialis]MCC3323502.1 HAD hydrolase-like protein [Gordonia bronchialis]QGS25521.1 HAD hydrolase-like protein [Gordonia bronchialis]
MRYSTLAVDLGGVLLTDPTRGGFWLEIAGGDENLAEIAKKRWIDHVRTPFETGRSSEFEVWNELSRVTGTHPEKIRSIFLDGFLEINHGVAGLLTLSKLGVKTILATNHYSPWLAIWRLKFPWFNTFNAIACSSEMHCRKPDTEYFFKLLEIAKEPVDSVLFVDDDSLNVKAARSANIPAIQADSDGLWVDSVVNEQMGI